MNSYALKYAADTKHLELEIYIAMVKVHNCRVKGVTSTSM